MSIFKRKIKDSDADGILDKDEKALGTNPKNPDTDRDGLGDYQEVNVYGTNPLNPDSDGDGMTDGKEVRTGRNPLGPGLLKDLFIPCEANNYRPQALRPQRLFFYTLSALMMKAIIIFFVISLPLTAWLTPDLMREQANRIISLTNGIRSNLGITILVENDLLNISAYNKAQDMLVNQYFAHVSSDGKRVGAWLKSIGYDYQVAGENLAMGFSSAENVVNAWTKSETHYQNMIDPDFTEIGVGVIAGNYIDKETTLVAQHFGSPKVIVNTEDIRLPVEEVVETEEVVDDIEIEESPILDDGSSVLSLKEVSPEPEVNLTIDEPVAKADSVIRAEVSLEEDIVSAEININEKSIPLSQDFEDQKLWTGSLIIPNEEIEGVLDPVVPASIKTIDQAGNINLFNADWNNIKPLKTTILDQYLFLKSYSSKYVQWLFSLSEGYYKVLLVITCLAFVLNIFVKIRKQNFQIILSSALFIILLTLLLLV